MELAPQITSPENIPPVPAPTPQELPPLPPLPPTQVQPPPPPKGSFSKVFTAIFVILLLILSSAAGLAWKTDYLDSYLPDSVKRLLNKETQEETNQPSGNGQTNNGERQNGSNQQQTEVDGITLNVDSPFLPGEFVSANLDDMSQITTSSASNPYRELAVIAVPYGPSPPTEGLPDAKPGGAGIYRSALADFRKEQSGTPTIGPEASLFGQIIVSSYSIVPLIIESEVETPTIIVEWVVEAESRLWIIRIARDLTDGTDPEQFLNSLKGLNIDIGID